MASWCSIVRACSLLAVVAIQGCHRKELPVYGDVPAFSLTDQSGRAFSSAALRGSVWIADFFFTNCTGPCPRMSSRLRQIEKQYSRPDLKLVSFTVDPQRDTPEVLASYSKKFQAEPDRWFFLTGPMAELDHLCRDVFLFGNVDGKLDHSTRFALVDRQSRIRGSYLTADAESIARLKADLETLLQESPP
jgi:protein SCO1